MQLWRVSLAGLLAIVAACLILAQDTPSASGPVTEIRMTAKKYEFAPDTVRVKVGDRVKLIITSLDHTHGIKLEAMHIDRKVEKGETITVEFIAGQPGTYPFECSHFCGLGHKKMKGQVIVAGD
ncbi:MAG: cupredoxin domain-containing protein [Acidobacteriia bacterium]|nr:cupredoxin domain-containing protein [Terriglobia bacterium]